MGTDVVSLLLGHLGLLLFTVTALGLIAYLAYAMARPEAF